LLRNNAAERSSYLKGILQTYYTAGLLF
jgi:hypothetical protein